MIVIAVFDNNFEKVISNVTALQFKNVSGLVDLEEIKIIKFC